MFEHHLDLKRTILHVHNAMREVKSKKKRAAVLRNLADLLITENATRWSSKLKLLQSFTANHIELVETSSHKDFELTVDVGAGFFAEST